MTGAPCSLHGPCHPGVATSPQMHSGSACRAAAATAPGWVLASTTLLATWGVRRRGWMTSMSCPGRLFPSRGGESGRGLRARRVASLTCFQNDEEGGGGHPSAAAPGKDAEATPAASSSSSYAYFPRPLPLAQRTAAGALHADYAACGGGPSAEDEGALGSAHRRGGGAAPGGDRHAGRDAGFLLSGYEGFSSSGGGGELWGAAHEHHASGGDGPSLPRLLLPLRPRGRGSVELVAQCCCGRDFGIPPSQRSPDSSRTGVGAVGGAAPHLRIDIARGRPCRPP